MGERMHEYIGTGVDRLASRFVGLSSVWLGRGVGVGGHSHSMFDRDPQASF